MGAKRVGWGSFARQIINPWIRGWQFQFSSPKIHKNQKMTKKPKSILMFYPPNFALFADLSSNSSPSRRALQFGWVKSGFGCTDVEKIDDLVSTTTFFRIFGGISGFSMLLPYFGLVLSFPDAFNMRF